MKKNNLEAEISGKVVKILDDYNIVINLGSDVVSYRDKIDIYEKASEVIDPDTKEILGSIDLVKAKVYVKKVYDKFSICYSDEKEESNMFGVLNVFATSTLPLNVNSEQKESLLLKDKSISIGDMVRVSKRYIQEEVYEEENNDTDYSID